MPPRLGFTACQEFSYGHKDVENAWVMACTRDKAQGFIKVKWVSANQLARLTKAKQLEIACSSCSDVGKIREVPDLFANDFLRVHGSQS